MANQASTAHNGQPRKHRERIRACSIALSSGSPLRGNLKWSELGQALVVTDDAIIVLSPLTGLHEALAGQSRAQDVESHPDWDGRFPHSVIQINVKTFLENEHSVRRRVLLESDHSSVDPRFLGVQWCSAVWSKPGMGPHAGCLILAATSELDLFVLGAPRNAWTGEWQLFHAVHLGPVADLTDLGPAPSPQAGFHADDDQDVFTRARALLRKKQMATEVLCATFVDIAESGLPTYIVAGTRSGHIAIWTCQAITGHCAFASATQVSNTGIDQLTVTTHIAAKSTNSQACVAFQDADSVRLCDLYAHETHASVQLSTLAPVLQDHCMITAWLWHRHQLIFSTIGEVHAYDARTGQVTVFSLATEPNHSCDPFSPAICISPCLDPMYSVSVVLQDLREYLIPSQQIAKAVSSPRVLSPTYPSPLLGYPPITANLQRKHDLHQAFLGNQSDSSSNLASASLVGVIHTDERPAFLGFNVSETNRYRMEVVRDSNITPEAILNEALKRVSLSTDTPPYPFVRIILALLYTCKQPDDFKHQLLSAAEDRWRPLTEASAGDLESSKLKQVRNAQQRLFYLLACRLDSPSLDHPATLSTSMRRHKELVVRDWLKRWLPDLAERVSGAQTSLTDKELLLRLSSAAGMLPEFSHQLLDACKSARIALKTFQATSAPGQGSSILTDENCAACETKLTLSWDHDQQDFGWSRCQSGHMWPRCSVSLATISEREVRVCTACWAKSLVPGNPGQSAWQTIMLEAATRCLYCGSCWILR